MAKRRERLEMFRQVTGKVTMKAPVLKVPSQGYWGAKVREYYR